MRTSSDANGGPRIRFGVLLLAIGLRQSSPGARGITAELRRRRLMPVALLAVLAGVLAACSQGGAGGAGTETDASAVGVSAVAGSAAPESSRSASTGPSAGLSMVVIGDSIPFNSPQDCPGCTGFVDRYAAAAQKATHRRVTVRNLSQHNGLTLPGLLEELDSFRAQLSAADIIVIGIAHNSNELASDTPCGAPITSDQLPDWRQMTPACSRASAEKYRPKYDQLFSTVAAWRSGAPTILRTINRYDDFRGAPTITLTADQQATVTAFLKTWDDMVCASAINAKFLCADIYRAFNGPAGDNPSGDLLGSDYTHPSDKGNELIAKTLIDEGFSPLA